jgi:hypothetical protein
MTPTSVGAIVLSATAAITSAQAQTQTAPPESTIWDHNGSVMYLVTNGSSQEFHYQKPRQGMLDAGARPGSVLFHGELNNGQFVGTAYIFNAHCGPIPFEVKGSILNDERIALSGQAPRVGRDCHPHGSYTSNLEFRRLTPNNAVQAQQPPAVQPSPIPVSKPDVPSGSRAESAPAAQSSVKNEAPLAAKDSSAGGTDPKLPSTSTIQGPMTNETTGAKGLRYYLLGAGLIVMIVWLLIVFFGRRLIRRTG